MKTFLNILFFLCIINCISQTKYDTPANELPEKISTLREAIDVIHFPKKNDPIKIEDRYYWKHITSILSKEDDITIIEYGAYLFYNNKWNLRKSYSLKELDKTFGTKKQRLLQGQPYTYNQNWRIGESLFGGWALWYFIGENSSGEKVCGYATIETTDQLLNNK